MPRFISLTQGHWAIVDNEDFDRLSRIKWRVVGKYAQCRLSGGAFVYMHRFILSAPSSMHVDHINGDGLDNRKSNLRLATRSQNAYNMSSHRTSTSHYKGVSWLAKVQRWRAAIKVPGKSVKNLGNFTSEIEAARAYDHAARLHFGEFARLNFPE